MVYEILFKGEANAVTGAVLCKVLGITRRELSQAVENERRAGVPICSSSGSKKGYYIAADKREMLNFCDSLDRRAGEIQRTRRACLKTALRLPQNA